MIYFICTTSRVGSTWLCDMLRSAGVFGSPDEWLNGPQSGEICRDLLHRNPLGIKGGPYMIPGICFYLLLSKRTCRFFRMYRRDKLAQARSWAIAKKTGCWGVREGQPELLPTVAVQEDEVEYFLNFIRRLDSEWDEFFAELGLESQTIFYEDLEEDPVGVVSEMADYLGVVWDSSAPLQSNLLKQRLLQDEGR